MKNDEGKVVYILAAENKQHGRNNEVVMKGYKAFKKGMVCRGKQYAENTVFEEENAEICKSGMHFCKNPLDVLDHYPLIDLDGNMAEFADVEALDECKTDDNKKFCTTRLKVGVKLSLPAFIKASFDFLWNKTYFEGNDAASGENSKLAASGENSQLAASGYNSQLAASGSHSKLAASGENSQFAASGHNSRLAASGENSKLAASGSHSKLAASGSYSQLAASGENSKLAASGKNSQLAASGSYSKFAASGENSKLAASGSHSKLAASGENSVVAGIGIDNIAKATKGSWITLAEWIYNRDTSRYEVVCVKTEFVDGENIKEDTFYKLENGEFAEV